MFLRPLTVNDLAKSRKVYVYDLGQIAYEPDKKNPLKGSVKRKFREPDALLEFDGYVYRDLPAKSKKTYGSYTKKPDNGPHYVQARSIFNHMPVPEMTRFQVCKNPLNVVSQDCLDSVFLWVRTHTTL